MQTFVYSKQILQKECTRLFKKKKKKTTPTLAPRKSRAFFSFLETLTSQLKREELFSGGRSIISKYNDK